MNILNLPQNLQQSPYKVFQSKLRGLSGGVTVIIPTQVGRVLLIMQNCERKGENKQTRTMEHDRI